MGAASLIPGCGGKSKSGGNRIAIVGAGIAGLHAAHLLAKGGLSSEIYEAGARAGGRILTIRNLVSPGQYTEAGGEFIDSSHTDMMSLAREMGLAIQDAQGGDLAGLIENAWFFGGHLRTEAEVAVAVRDFTTAIQMDIGRLPEAISAGTAGFAAELDRMSLEEYLHRRGVTGWLRDLVTAAYVSEFGLDAGRQSCLNLLTLVSLDTSAGRFEVFGESDERFRIAGGNQALTDALAARYAASLRLNHRLEAVAADGDGYRLSFLGPGGAVETKADAVILALPFTLLRSVDFKIDLPEAKRKCIAELGYGTNSKLFLGFSSRPWRKAGYAGNFFTDGPIQSGWEHTKVQPGEAGGITVFQGGTAGLDLAKGGPAAQAEALAGPLDRVFPGTMAARNGNVGAFHWPTYPLSLGSYACYMPGQWTGLSGEEGKPVGNLFFAGEHCSAEFQGYMNGGALTGRLAAEAILAKSAARKSLH
ncbi:MAG: FAD-binding protein [Fibrobacteres bacterium]|nr:FAD-binding protein [Fibrobacterota bacterium]